MVQYMFRVVARARRESWPGLSTPGFCGTRGVTNWDYWLKRDRLKHGLESVLGPCLRNFIVSRAILWRPVVVASLLLAMTVGQSQAEPVRVVTFNLLPGGPWSGLIGNGADLNERLEIVVEQLAALRPDVVALQEASVGGKRGNVAERLGRALGTEGIPAPTTSQVFGIGWLDRAIT